MSQVLVCFDPETQTVDFAEDDNGFISLEGGLETSTLYSILSNQRAPASNTEHVDQPFGWWGDDFPEVDGDLWGSLVWLYLGRSVINVTTLRALQLAVESCLKWMLDDGLASTIVVAVTRLEEPLDGVRIATNITDPEGNQFDEIWIVHRNAVRGTT